jgi:lipoprotein-anchoring transpeptidase ErfK/SrfK
MSSAYTDGRYWKLPHMVRFYLQPGHHLWIGFHAVPVTPGGRLIQPLSSLGDPAYRSHGCVRQHPTNAAYLFAFAPVGTRVVVIP